MADGYLIRRRQYRDVSTTQVVAAATTSVSPLIACRGSHWTIYIQRYHIQTTTGSAKTWTLRDSAGTPIPISGDLDTTTAPATYEKDFGTIGVPLTEAKDLNLIISAAGAAGIVTIEGYMKMSSTNDINTANTAQ